MFANLIWPIIGNRFGAVVIGIALLVTGPLVWDSSHVTCGGSEMRPGDQCRTVRGSSSVTRTYEEQKSHDEMFRLIWMAVGGVSLVGGAVQIVIKLRRRNADRPATTTVAAG